MTNQEKFAEAIRLLDEGNVTAAGDLITELGSFFSRLMEYLASDHLIIHHPSQASRHFIMHDEGNGPYLLPEPATINWGEAG